MIFSLSESKAGESVGKVNPVVPRWLLWVDGVGGYLLLPGDDWTIGGPSGSDDAEICVQGDLSRREACIRRQGSDYVLQPLGTVLLGGRRMNRPAMLRDGDLLNLGPVASGSSVGGGVRVEFSKPHPLSASARLTMMGRHRTSPRCDGIILLADTCILGPTRSSHIPTAMAEAEVVLLYREGQWFCRSTCEGVLDGQSVQGRVNLPAGSRMEVAGLAFTLEAVDG